MQLVIQLEPGTPGIGKEAVLKILNADRALLGIFDTVLISPSKDS
jgi:hypothetical protein